MPATASQGALSAGLLTQPIRGVVEIEEIKPLRLIYNVTTGLLVTLPSDVFSNKALKVVTVDGEVLGSDAVQTTSCSPAIGR